MKKIIAANSNRGFHKSLSGIEYFYDHFYPRSAINFPQSEGYGIYGRRTYAGGDKSTLLYKFYEIARIPGENDHRIYTSFNEKAFVQENFLKEFFELDESSEKFLPEDQTILELDIEESLELKTTAGKIFFPQPISTLSVSPTVKNTIGNKNHLFPIFYYKNNNLSFKNFDPDTEIRVLAFTNIKKRVVESEAVYKNIKISELNSDENLYIFPVKVSFNYFQAGLDKDHEIEQTCLYVFGCNINLEKVPLRARNFLSSLYSDLAGQDSRSYFFSKPARPQNLPSWLPPDFYLDEFSIQETKISPPIDQVAIISKANVIKTNPILKDFFKSNAKRLKTQSILESEKIDLSYYEGRLKNIEETIIAYLQDKEKTLSFLKLQQEKVSKQETLLNEIAEKLKDKEKNAQEVFSELISEDFKKEAFLNFPGITVLDIDSTFKDFSLDKFSLKTFENTKINSITLMVERFICSVYDGKKVVGKIELGPLYVIADSNGDIGAKPLIDTIVASDSLNPSRYKFHPHIDWRYIDSEQNLSLFFNQFTYGCSGAARSVFPSAFASGDLETIILAVLSWLTSCDSRDAWGSSWKNFKTRVEFDKAIENQEIERVAPTEKKMKIIEEIEEEIDAIQL